MRTDAQARITREELAREARAYEVHERLVARLACDDVPLFGRGDNHLRLLDLALCVCVCVCVCYVCEFEWQRV